MDRRAQETSREFLPAANVPATASGRFSTFLNSSTTR